MVTELSRVESLFFAALKQGGPEDRQRFLNEACEDNVDLRARVERLLAAHHDVSGFMEQNAAGILATEDSVLKERPGVMIGHYKILQQIGEGGFGVVFMAEQQEPVVRKVALKVVKPGMDTKEVVARFEAERQALAMMDHPNIAKVYDGGATDSGRPYFVMELVRGIPITDYCDGNELATYERLQLFASVCNAIQHAHQKGVIHRDIKPSNVLVTLHDGLPVVKVIDFGVAKAIHQRLTDKTLFTNFMQMVGTPLYMSPEQAEMSGLDIDTRTDIYSLGVLLYELLVGTTPFDRDRLKAAAYDEIRRIIREEEPLRPSHRISTLGETITYICSHRKTEPKKLSRMVRGELDWIVMKALEKDRNRRYESAGEFSRDIQRHLAHEPVQAGPPSVWYRLRKHVRRNRGVFAGFVVIVAAVLMGLGGSIWGLMRANKERDRALVAQKIARQEEAKAEKAASDAQSALEIVANVLGGRGARYYDNPERTVMQLLDSLAARLDADEIRNPYVEANLRYMLGRAYHDADRFLDAEPQLKKALELQRAVYGNDDKKVAETLLWLAINAKRDRSLAPAGEAFARESLAIYQRMTEHGVSGQVATAYSELSAVLLTQGKSEEAVAASERAVEIELDVTGRNTGWTLLHMAHCYGAVKKLQREAACLEKAYDLFERDTEPRGSWLCQRSLADVYSQLGQIDKAFEAGTRAVSLADAQGILRLQRKRESLGILATRYREVGDRDSEISCLRQILNLAAEAKDLDSQDMYFHRVSLAQALHDTGLQAEAASVAGEVLKSIQRARDNESVVWNEYADRLTMAELCRLSGGDRKAAEEVLSIVADAQPFRNGADALLVAFENGIKAQTFDVVGRRDDAIRCARAQLEAVPVDLIDWYDQAETILVKLLKSSVTPVDACQVLEQGIRKRVETLGNTHFAVDLARLKLAMELCEQMKFAEAESVVEQIHTRLLEYTHVSSSHKRRLIELLVESCQQRGDDQQATLWRQKLAEIDASRDGDIKE